MQAADSISIVEMFSEIAVALDENRAALSGSSALANGHGERMSSMFAEIETAIARLEPAEWPPGRYFDLAAETLLQTNGLEASLYAAAFRRAGTAVMRQPHLSAEEFGLALSAIASGLSENANGKPEIEAMSATWEAAAKAFRDAASEGLFSPRRPSGGIERRAGFRAHRKADTALRSIGKPYHPRHARRAGVIQNQRVVGES